MSNSLERDPTIPAIEGGPRTRPQPMPARKAFGATECDALNAAVEYYRSRDEDPPYQGVFEKQFCDAFCDYMGGGFADAVSSGTAACLVAVAALGLPEGSEVLISPVTDSGPLNALIMLGLKPRLVDSRPGSFNIGVDQFLERITPNTRALFAVHSAGEPLEMEALMAVAQEHGIKVVEDCSQSPGALCNGKPVGSFGDTAAFSTMYRKSLAGGGSGGIVYSKDEGYYHMALAHADRGKQIWRTDISEKDPSQGLFPALNFNSNEFSCAIGLASLNRLQETIQKRIAFVAHFIKILEQRSEFCRAYDFNDDFSPFFHPIFVNADALNCTKVEFAEALSAEGIGVNTHYGCVVSAWEFAQPYLSDTFFAANAMQVRDTSFNLFLHEAYTEQEATDIVDAIVKLERYYKVG